MLIIGLVIGAVALAVIVGFWATRGGETVDLGSPEARQRAAASWMLDGQGEEAERMLGKAVALLEGWDKALALVDLASFLAASDRDSEAGAALQEALKIAEPLGEAPAEELVEMRVQWAQALSRQGLIEEARSVLLETIENAAAELVLGLAEEAYAEFLVRHGDLDEAIERYGRACKRLAVADHDRAPIAQVRYAHVLLLQKKGDFWRDMGALSEELQHAVPLALAHLVETFEVEESLELIDTLLTRIPPSEDWGEERTTLDALALELRAAPAS